MNNEEKNKEKLKEKKKRTLLQKIVNIFLYAGIGFLLLLLILFGISQTSTFREFLRDKVIEEANSAINGELFIEEIDGTIFTSLVLRNTIVTLENDTLLNAETIGVMTSPLQLLLKQIHIRHFEIKNASINLNRDASGELNITRLLPPSEEAELDTTKSEFPFTIQIADFKLNNFNFSLKDNSIENSAFYDTLNFNNLEIRNLNLNLAAKLIIKENIYELALNHLSFNTNIKGFAINELQGGFLLSEGGIDAHKLYLKTPRSEIIINASARYMNIFDTLGVDINNSDLIFQAAANEFSFDDLRVFAPSLNMLNGKTAFRLNVSGTTRHLNLENILVSFENSKIEGTGELKNLLDENLLISADLSGSYINQFDIKNLLAGVEVPVYPELGVIQFDTLTYNGSPSDFKSGINISTERGNISGLIGLNLKNEPIQYDINIKTKDVDIEPFAGSKSSLNLTAEIKGKGVEPETFDGSIKLFANGSSINGNKIDTLRLTANAENKFIEYEFRLASDETTADLKGSFDFAPEEPVYQVEGEILNLNLAEFVHDTTMESNLNLTLSADGDGFNQDDLDLFLSAILYESNFGDIEIDSTRLIVDIRSDPGERVINIISDLADITIMGNYKVAQAVDLIVSEFSLLSSAFSEKLGNILPEVTEEEKFEGKAGLKPREPLFTQVDEPVNFNYLIDLKDFSLVSAFIGSHNLEIDAEMGGRFESTNDSVLFSFNTNLRYIKIWNNEEAYFVSNMLVDLDVLNSFGAVSTSDLNLDMGISAERIFTGSDIYNFAFSMEMKEDVANINFGANPEPYFTKLISKIDLSRNILDVSVDTLRFVYDDFEIMNRDKLKFLYDGNRLDIDQFKLVRNNSEFSIKGHLSQTDDQNLEINLLDWRGEDLSITFMDVKPENTVQASINLDANITGNFNSPLINAKLFIDSIAYGEKTFGELESIFNYGNRRLDINLTFVDSALNKNDTALTIRGHIPVDLSFTGAEENFMESSPMNIALVSDGFNLGAFGDILPAVNRLRGELSSDLILTGTPSSLKTEGYLRLDNAAFFLEANNLEYNASLLINIDGRRLRLDSLFVANAPGTRNGGKITGNGSAILDNFNITSSKFSFSGDLKVLSEASRYSNSSVYGELVIGIEGNVELEFEEDRIFVHAPILIKRGADVTIPQSQSAYQSGSANYVYHFAEDKIPPDEEEDIGFERLVDISQGNNEDEQKAKAKTGIFDYDITVRIEDEAEVTFVLSREFNQNLVAILGGKIRLEKYGSRTKAIGKMELLEGSTIQFLKTLEAEGSIDFPSGELSNPYLDITAIYFDYYYPVDGADAGEEIPVEVRLFINGPLNDLSKRLVAGEENIKVYYGAKSIADNTPSPVHDASDAVMFILLGKFYTGDTQDRNEIASAAAGLAGSLVGGFLNEQFGDAVRSVELRQVGSSTIISLVGRAGKFRYEIGTSTDVYQDLSRANVRIQYPITQKLFIRLERKESINKESAFTTEMINEVGLKYLFEF